MIKPALGRSILIHFSRSAGDAIAFCQGKFELFVVEMFSLSGKIFFLLCCLVMTESGARAEKSSDEIWRDLLSFARDGVPAGEDASAWRSVESEDSDFFRLLSAEVGEDGGLSGEKPLSSAPARPEAEEITPDDLPVRGSSLVFVFDSTGSMESELVQVKIGASKILEALRVNPEVPIHNYILIPFNDPGMGPITVTTDHAEFRESMENITAWGGGDCPEITVEAVKKALQLSLPNSHIYVFTDASAKDFRLKNEVRSLIQRKRSQVDFIMTGDCGTTTTEDYRVFEEIADTGSGQVYRLSKSEVKEVLKYVKVALRSNVVNLLSQQKPAPPQDLPDEHEVVVDETLQEFTISVSGKNPSINLTDPKGKSVDGPPKVTSLLHLDNVKIVSVKEPDPGSWKVLINSESDYRLRSTGLSAVNFRHGFSTVETVNIRETNYRPLKGASCFLLIETSDVEEVYNITTVDLVDMKGDIMKRFHLEPVLGSRGLYRTGSFLPPLDFFYLGILGHGKDGLPIKRITTTAINPQSPEKPIVSVPSRIHVPLHADKKLICLVESVVPSTILWYKNGEYTGFRHQCSQTCNVAYQLEKVTSRAEGNYSCYAINIAGNSLGTTVVAVTGSVPVVKVSRNVSARIGETAQLPCTIESELPYTVHWNKFTARNYSSGIVHPVSKGDTLGDTLILGPIEEDDEGWYVCIAQSKTGRSEGRIFLQVRLPLTVTVQPKVIRYSNGESIRLSCTSTGRSRATLQWRVNRQIINDEPETLIREEKTDDRLDLLIPFASKKYEGVYTCLAETQEESKSESSELIYMEKPTIIAENKSLTAKEGDEARLRCRAEGAPRPEVKWFKDGEEVLTDSRKEVLETGELILKTVRTSDSGEFSCSATNDLGTDVDYIALFAGSSPLFLQTPKDRRVEIYQRATIPCSAIGAPMPEVRWKRIGGGEMNLKRIMVSPAGALKILRMDVEDVGRYECTAQNIFGSISAEVLIDIIGIEKPTPKKTMKLSEVKGIAGSDITIPCGISLGNPPGKVEWTKGGARVEEDGKKITDGNGNLVIQNSTGNDRGSYSCHVYNWAGNTSRTFEILISESPRIAENFTVNVRGQKGGEIVIPCPAEGYPSPTISWSKNGSALPASPTIFQDENGSLIIRNLNEENSGTYVCHGHNSVGSASKAVSVQVQVPPEFVEEPLDQSLNIVEGYMVLLNCKSKAIPKAKIRWFKNGNSLLEDEQVVEQPENLRFTASTHDAGLYRCVVVNEIGSISKEFNVTVLVPPSSDDSDDGTTIEAKAGMQLTLTCRVRGEPKPTILWQRNGMYLTQNTSDVTVTDSGLLILGNITVDSAGAYVCDAENLAGIIQRIYYIQVHYAPIINGKRNSTRSISVKEGEEITMPCFVEANPRPLVVWRKNGLLLLGDQMDNVILLGDNTLVLLQAKHDSRGTYKCEATNEEGSSFQDYEVEVLSPPLVAPDEYHTRKKVNEGEPIVLTCPVFNSVPPPTIQWLKDGMPLSRLLQERADEAKIKLSEDHRELSFAETHPSDRGNYSCTATNSAGRADAKFLIDVLMTPHFEEFNHVAHRTILTGGEVALNCSVSGNPQPKVTWRKGMTPITPENHPGVRVSLDKQHLVIQNGKVHHSGTYICTAVNEVNRKEREFYVSVLEPPVISGLEEEAVEAVRGTSLSLHCPFSGIPQPRILWIKVGQNKTLFKGSEEYFEMRDITCEDSGIYVCEVTNTAGTKTKKFNVTVLEPPDIESHNVVEEVVVHEGESVSLRCKAKGHPQPDITWFYKGEIIRKSRTARSRKHVPEFLTDLDVTEDGFVNLTITNVTGDYSGLYTVLASNKAGVVEKNFQVSVYSQPRVREDRGDPELVTVPKAFPIVLKCQVFGEPPPEIQWFHNGNPLVEDNNIYLIDNELEVVNANENHSGNFTCFSRNSVGNITLNFTVDVIVPPRFPTTETSLQVKANESFILHCGDDEGEDRSTTLSWLRKSFIISNSTKFSVSASGKKLTITNATFEDSGEYLCIASNIAGFSKITFKIDVLEPPGLSEPIPGGRKRIELYHPFSLRCPFTSRPEPHITWHKDGVVMRIQEDGRIHKAGPLLIMTRALAEDSGEYKCIALNAAGIKEFIHEVEVYVEAEWNIWSDWSPCSVSCGLGEQIRTRTCRLDEFEKGIRIVISNCVGESSEKRTCFIQCKVDGGWGKWSNWTPYSATCGKAVRRKLRFCNNPKPADGGKMCSGAAVMEEYTSLGACPVHGRWSEWSEWSLCSKSCDGGSKKRERKCDSPPPEIGGQSCRGPSTDMKPCNKHKCPGDWLGWGEWGPCSATCGRGQRKRFRKCKPIGEECLGDNLQIEKCVLEKCGGSGVPSLANFQVVGSLNGRNVGQSFDVSIDSVMNERLISVNMNDILHQDDKWFPYTQFLLSPLSWSTAFEKDDADNGYSLTNGNYFSLSDIKFATGEGLIVKHKGEGVNSDGSLQVQIEVVGEVPLVEPHASVVIQNMNHEFVQIGPNRLYSSLHNDFDVEGEKLPFTWNSSIQYNNTRGTMPYLVEKLSVKDIRNVYNPDTQNITYMSSSTIGKGYEENKCPRGFFHEPDMMHCRDVDECEENISTCGVNQRCQNTFGSYSCICNEGFVASRNGAECSDIDECLLKPSICSHFCHNRPGTFACSCPYGFYLGEDLRTCEELYLEERSSFMVEKNTSGTNLSHFAELKATHVHEKRNETENHDRENCPPGFYLHQEECKDWNECHEEVNLCDEDEICLNTLGSYQCLNTPCPQGFNRDFRTKNCIKHCEHKKSCLSSTLISEMVVFNAVSLTSTSPLKDILQLDILPQRGLRIVATKFRIVESGKLFRVRETRGRASLYALHVLNKDTLYRVKIEAKAYGTNSQLAYYVEFVVFIIVI